MKARSRSMPEAYRAAAEGALGRQLAVAAEAVYGSLVAEQPVPEDSKLRSHLYKNILSGLAIYRALLDTGLDQKAALASVDRAFDLLSRASRRKMERIGRIPFLYPMLRVYVRIAMRAYPKSGWDIEWLETSRDRIRFDMSRCYYFDTLRSLGSPELTASFCRIDDLVYGGASAAYEWRRTKTIARGDDRCDFCFERAGRPGA
jgi:hypothetical protein